MRVGVVVWVMSRGGHGPWLRSAGGNDSGEGLASGGTGEIRGRADYRQAVFGEGLCIARGETERMRQWLIIACLEE